jgi:hypothetical protein
MFGVGNTGRLSVGSASRRRAPGAVLPPLSLISATAAAAYGPRRLRADYTGPAMRVRRSADDAQLDIPLATAVQTRTNLMPVPLVDNGPPVGGITVTQLGSGVEFGQPYIDVRWQGTATASGALVFRQGPGGIYNPAVHAAVTPGLVYTASLGYRLIGGTAPTQQLSIRLIQRAANATAISFGTVYNLPAPTAALRRAVAMDVILSGVTYAHAQFGYSLAINDTVDVTLRLYANNLEQGIGNLRPLLQRNVPEVVAAPGDLDLETLANFVGGENLLTWSDDVSNVAWSGTGLSSRTATEIVEDAAAATQHRLSRSISLGLGANTVSTRVQRGFGTRQFQFGISGTGLVARAYFDLGTGTVGATDQCTAAIADLGGGEFLVSMTATVVTAGAHTVFYAMANGTTIGSETYTGNGTSSLFIRNTQLRQGLLGRYNATTSTAIALTAVHNGLIPTWYDQGRYWHAVPRNLLTHTEELDNAAWSKTGVTVTANSVTAPDGSLTADVLAGTPGASTIFLQQTLTRAINPGDAFAGSVWVRNASSNIQMRVFRTGPSTAESATLIVPQSSSWQRLAIPITFALAHTGVRLDFVAQNSNPVSIEVWGAQLENATLSDYQPILTGTPLNATQATAANQPQIVVGGAVHIAGTRAVPSFAGAQGLLVPEITSLGNTYSLNAVATTNAATGAILSSRGAAGINPQLDIVAAATLRLLVRDNSAANSIAAQRAMPAGEQTVISAIRAGNSGALSTNGVTTTGAATPAAIGALTTTTGLGIGADFAPTFGAWLTGSVGECIVFASALSTADRQALERNQGAYYGVPVA